MFTPRFRLPSPALVISMVTLSFVLGGTAVAAGTAKHSDAKADRALIEKMAPTLNVNYAKTTGSADTAANATNATNAVNAVQLGAHPASYYAHVGHEAVQLVGTVGEPGFRNGWANYGGAWSHAGFWKDAFGVVHLQGTLTGKSANKVAFQLPAGYRPATDLFTVAANATHASSIEILTNGELLIIQAGSIGIDGLSFLAGPTTATAGPQSSAHNPSGR
jgi:hypothetical protein